MNEARTAIVDGGAGGTGSDVCRRLVDAETRVAVVDLDVEGATRVAASLPGREHKFPSADVTDSLSVEAAFDRIEADHPAAVLVVVARVNSPSRARRQAPAICHWRTGNAR